MNRWLSGAWIAALLFSLLLLAPMPESQASQALDSYALGFENTQGQSDAREAETQSAELMLGEEPQSTAGNQAHSPEAGKASAEGDAKNPALMKTHLINGNDAIREAQAIRRQVATATGDQKAALMAKMKADYETAVAEYREALKLEMIEEEESITPIGLIGVEHDGLISKDKAVEMLTDHKNLPILLTNLGLAYSGAEDYQDGIPVLQQATIIKAEPSTYMQLGTDQATVGKVQDGMTTCDKITSADPTATGMLAACYRNIAVVLTNNGRFPDAIAPLKRATQLDPEDALGWKLLGDALLNSMTTKQDQGKTVYSIPPGTIEAYQHYLELEPSGVYAGQIKATLEGLAQLQKSQ